MPAHYHLLLVSPFHTETFLSSPPAPLPPPITAHRSVLLDLLVVGDDLPDAVDEAALVVGDEAHEYSLLGGVEKHQHSHFTRRSRVGEVDAAGLQGESQGSFRP